MTTQTEEKLFDVVIYKIEDRVVASVVGTDMRKDDGHYNANRRLETALDRINDRYAAAIVPAGNYSKGSVVLKKDL